MYLYLLNDQLHQDEQYVTEAIVILFLNKKQQIKQQRFNKWIIWDNKPLDDHHQVHRRLLLAKKFLGQLVHV